VLILTCHPERYEALREKHVIDFPRIGAASA
jgi:hypothetical protein